MSIAHLTSYRLLLPKLPERLLLPDERLLPKPPEEGRVTLGVVLPDWRKVLEPKPDPVERLPVLTRGVVRIVG